MLTATHTHAAAGGYNEYFLYHITAWGFVKQSFDAMLEGILQVGL
jgi:neutral ceramidase